MKKPTTTKGFDKKINEYLANPNPTEDEFKEFCEIFLESLKFEMKKFEGIDNSFINGLRERYQKLIDKYEHKLNTL